MNEAVFENLAKFTRKHLYRSLFFKCSEGFITKLCRALERFRRSI